MEDIQKSEIMALTKAFFDAAGKAKDTELRALINKLKTDITEALKADADHVPGEGIANLSRRSITAETITTRRIRGYHDAHKMAVDLLVDLEKDMSRLPVSKRGYFEKKYRAFEDFTQTLGRELSNYYHQLKAK